MESVSIQNIKTKVSPSRCSPLLFHVTFLHEVVTITQQPEGSCFEFSGVLESGSEAEDYPGALYVWFT